MVPQEKLAEKLFPSGSYIKCILVVIKDYESAFDAV